MEKINYKNTSLKKSFFSAATITVVIVLFCSAMTIYGCYRIQQIILPDINEIWLSFSTTYSDGTVIEGKQKLEWDQPTQLYQLIQDGSMASEEIGKTEYTLEKIESSYSLLSPKKKFFYQGLSFAMVMLPLLYASVGISICAWWFYKTRLAPPLELLSNATEQIGKQNLDFSIAYSRQDEMGRLCISFEEMRKALYNNNLSLWNILEERRMLQASVAHDLRNPIAIICGYVEYLIKNVPQGKISQSKLLHTLDNLYITSKRLECYTNSVRDIYSLENVEVHRIPSKLPDLFKNMSDDFAIIAEQKGLKLNTVFHVPQCTAQIDPQILYRILENIFVNALRFARKEIRIEFSMKEYNQLSVRIIDDGKGFPEKILKKQNTLILTTDTTGEHLGMGLIISQILCQKLDGQLKILNNEDGGAEVRVKVTIPV